MRSKDEKNLRQSERKRRNKEKIENNKIKAQKKTTNKSRQLGEKNLTKQMREKT